MFVFPGTFSISGISVRERRSAWLRWHAIQVVALIAILGPAVAGCDSAVDESPPLRGRFEGVFTYTAPPGPFSPGGEVS